MTLNMKNSNVNRQQKLIEYFSENFSFGETLPTQQDIAKAVKINVADVSKTMIELEAIGFLIKEHTRAYYMNKSYMHPDRKRRIFSVMNEAFSLCRAS